MKNKIKPIIWICFVFLIILSITYTTNAADNVKALQDKYRISYNNFTKALKDGADQDQIDQLSVQCKADYAEYQNAIKSKDNSMNKFNAYSSGNLAPKSTVTIDNKAKKLPSKNNQALKPQNKSVSKNTTKIQANNIISEPLIIKKSIKVVINGKEKVIMVPSPNPDFLKKHPPMKQNIKSGSNNSAKRIGKNYEVPLSIEVLGYPLDPNDPLRCEGEKEVSDLYSLVATVNSDNIDQVLNDAYTLANKISEKYGNYPDICLIAHIYCADLIVSYFKQINYFSSYVHSNSFSFFQYNQIGLQYAHLATTNNTMKTLFEVIADRKSEIHANDNGLIKSNEEYRKVIADERASIEANKNGIQYTQYVNSTQHPNDPPPSDLFLSFFAGSMTSGYDVIYANYLMIYSNYLEMNDRDNADKILKIVKNGDEYNVSGELFDAYKSMPYSMQYKYLYIECSTAGSDQGSPTLNKFQNKRNESEVYVTTTREITILMRRDADSFLYWLNERKKIQCGYEDVIEADGNSRNKRQVLEIADYIHDYKPEEGNEAKNIATEYITPDALKKYKDYAYSEGNDDNNIDYYKRTPYVSELYFSDSEDTKLPETSISIPEEYSFLRAKIDSSQPSAPDYAFVAQVYTVKNLQSQDSPTPEPEPNPTPGPVALNKAEIEPEIDRQKFVTMVPDLLFNGYHAKFRVNENTAGDDVPGSIPIPAKSAKKVKDKSGKTKTETVWSKLVNNAKDAEKESICCIENSYDENYAGNAITKSFYLNNNYFINKSNTSIRNIRGLFNNNYSDGDKIIISKITPESIKCGGMQWVFVNSGSCTSSEPTFKRHLHKNQANWLIITAHGALSAHAGHTGGIAIENEYGTLDFSISPAELIKDINTPHEKSEYSEDVDVLVLMTCTSLALTLDSNNDKFVRGWHKVLPKGVILGFNGFTSEDINWHLTKDLNDYLNELAAKGQKATPSGLKEFWRSKNETYYNSYMSGKPQYELLQNSKNATIVYENKRYTYNVIKNTKVQPPKWDFIENAPDAL